MCGNLHVSSYLSVYSRYWRSILAVHFVVYGRILRNIRLYTRSIRGLSLFQPCHHSHQLPPPPPLQLLMSLQPTKTLYPQKSTIFRCDPFMHIAHYIISHDIYLHVFGCILLLPHALHAKPDALSAKAFCPNHQQVPESEASRWRECPSPHRMTYGLLSFQPWKQWRISILKAFLLHSVGMEKN